MFLTWRRSWKLASNKVTWVIGFCEWEFAFRTVMKLCWDSGLNEPLADLLSPVPLAISNDWIRQALAESELRKMYYVHLATACLGLPVNHTCNTLICWTISDNVPSRELGLNNDKCIGTQWMYSLFCGRYFHASHLSHCLQFKSNECVSHICWSFNYVSLHHILKIATIFEMHRECLISWAAWDKRFSSCLHHEIIFVVPLLENSGQLWERESRACLMSYVLMRQNEILAHCNWTDL